MENNASNPISIVYGISTSERTANQFLASYDLTQLPQNNYIREFILKMFYSP